MHLAPGAKCTEIWSEKALDLCHLRPIWPTLEPNLPSLACTLPILFPRSRFSFDDDKLFKCRATPHAVNPLLVSFTDKVIYISCIRCSSSKPHACLVLFCHLIKRSELIRRIQWNFPHFPSFRLLFFKSFNLNSNYYIFNFPFLTLFLSFKLTTQLINFFDFHYITLVNNIKIPFHFE